MDPSIRVSIVAFPVGPEEWKTRLIDRVLGSQRKQVKMVIWGVWEDDLKWPPRITT